MNRRIMTCALAKQAVPCLTANSQAGFSGNWWAVLLVSLFFILTHTARAQETQLKKIGYSVLPGNKVEIELDFNGTPPTPAGFPTYNPARLVFDFPGIGLDVAERFQRVGVGTVSAINAVEANGRTRVVVDLVRPVSYEVSAQQERLVLSLGSGGGTEQFIPPQEESVTHAAKVNFAPVEAASTAGPALQNVDFRRGEDGSGRILINLSQADIPIEIEQKGYEVLLNFKATNLPEKLNRKLDVTDFATAVSTVDTTQKGKDVQMVITSKGDYDYLGYQTDNIYTVEVKQKIPDPGEELDISKKKYTGERISLNFQKISTQAVLTLLAEMQNFNIVTTDEVRGDVALRLKNVPWDQAWDIILESKALGYREVGNVRTIDLKTNIAKREEDELQSKKKIQELEPLHTEFMQINYSKAATLRSLLKSQTGTDVQHSFLSARGSVSIDERTNTLLVQDTAERLAEVRRLIAALDKPVRQVLIESRVVIANDDFAKDLGVRFGQYTNAHLTNSPTWGITTGNITVDSAATTATQKYLVDLPAAPTNSLLGSPASFGLAIGKVGTYLLGLELSALQSEGRGEIVSSPRVITANQQEAIIKQGVEIAIDGVAGVGAVAAPTFKEAVLELKVTPQITPDDRIIMSLGIKKDNPQAGSAGTFERREVKTQVLVDNGETVVLGGVYEQTLSDKVSRVPFFGDLPVVGVLFRKHQEGNSKKELLIFVTPKILQESS